MAELHRVLGRIEGKLDAALEVQHNHSAALKGVTNEVRELQTFRTRVKATGAGAGMVISGASAVLAFYAKVKGIF